MAKSFHILKGKVSWVKHIKPDDKFGDPKWSVKLHPDAESLDKIKAWMEQKDNIQGIKNTLGKDDDGYYMVFSRPVTRMYSGKVVPFLPPEVVKSDGSPMGDVAIGNGSDGIVRVEYYTWPLRGQPDKRGQALRWDGLRIDNLIPYEAKRDLTEEQFKKVEHLVEQPKPAWG